MGLKPLSKAKHNKFAVALEIKHLPRLESWSSPWHLKEAKEI